MASIILRVARGEAAKRARGLAHPQLCIDAIEHGVMHGGEEGLKKVGTSPTMSQRLCPRGASVCLYVCLVPQNLRKRALPPSLGKSWPAGSPARHTHAPLLPRCLPAKLMPPAPSPAVPTTPPRTRPVPPPLQEVECFVKAASLDTHKALVHIFFAQRSTKKVAGVTDAGEGGRGCGRSPGGTTCTRMSTMHGHHA